MYLIELLCLFWCRISKNQRSRCSGEMLAMLHKYSKDKIHSIFTLHISK